MPENVSVQIIVRTRGGRPEDEFAAELQRAFLEHGVTASVRNEPMTIKTMQPIDIIIATSFIGAVLNRYVFVPVLQNAEGFAKRWAAALRRKPAIVPIRLTVLVQGDDIHTEFITPRALFDDTFLETVFDRLGTALEISQRAGRLKLTPRFELDTDAEQVRIVGYQSEKPAYVVDVDTYSILPLNGDPIVTYQNLTDPEKQKLAGLRQRLQQQFKSKL